MIRLTDVVGPRLKPITAEYAEDAEESVLKIVSLAVVAMMFLTAGIIFLLLGAASSTNGWFARKNSKPPEVAGVLSGMNPGFPFPATVVMMPADTLRIRRFPTSAI